MAEPARMLGCLVFWRQKMKIEPEIITDELKKLVRGASVYRLYSLYHLRHVLGADHLPSPRKAGAHMRRTLIRDINSISGSYEFDDELIPAEKMNRAYRLLFEIEGVGQDVPARRRRAITALGLYYSPEQWRKREKLEWHFLLILAEHLCAQPRQTLTKP
jgi:hypothetical protein